MESFRAALPDLVEKDVIGSAYSIRNYKVAGRFGGRARTRRGACVRWPSEACG